MAFILHNILVLFDLLFDTVALKKAKRSVGYKHWFQNSYGDVLIRRGVKIAEFNKLNLNANTIIKFMRRVTVLRLTLTKLYVQLQRRAHARVRRQQRLRDRTNNHNQQRHAGSRPTKRKRGGRPPGRPPVCPFTPPTTQPRRPDNYTPVVPSTSPRASHAKLFARYLRRRQKFVPPPFRRLPAVIQERLRTLSFANRTPAFVPKRRGRKSKGKKTPDGMQVGGVLHRYLPTKELQSRRGRRVALRSTCVNCYANSPTPVTGGRKTKTATGASIPRTTYACETCRVLLCKHCFWNSYDHRSRGKVCDFVTLQ